VTLQGGEDKGSRLKIGSVGKGLFPKAEGTKKVFKSWVWVKGKLRGTLLQLPGKNTRLQNIHGGEEMGYQSQGGAFFPDSTKPRKKNRWVQLFEKRGGTGSFFS